MSRVGNFLGKLFSGQPDNGNHALLRAYGKLPMYAEYRRLELSKGKKKEGEKGEREKRKEERGRKGGKGKEKLEKKLIENLEN